MSVCEAVLVELPSDSPQDFANLFRLERSRLLDLLRSLTVEDWRRPTPCPGWNVLGLANHLVGGDLSVVSRQRDDHHGTPAPPGLTEVAFIAWLDGLQTEWVHAARRISPRIAVDLLDWLADQVADTVATQDARSWTANVSWASQSPVPVWLDQARELAERWIHRQQLLEAVGRPSDLNEDLAGPVLDALRWAYRHRLTESRVAVSSVLIGVHEPFARTWRLANDDGSWSFADDDGSVADAALSMSVEQAWRLLSNNYSTVAHGPLRTAGDPNAVDVLLRTRAIIGVPKMR